MTTVAQSDPDRQVSAVQIGYHGRCDRCGELADHTSRGTVEEALDDATQCPCRDEDEAPDARPTSLGALAVQQLRENTGPRP